MLILVHFKKDNLFLRSFFFFKDNYIELPLSINVQHAPTLAQHQIWSNQGPGGSVGGHNVGDDVLHRIYR